jgi:hypothetical protein
LFENPIWEIDNMILLHYSSRASQPEIVINREKEVYTFQLEFF